MTDDDTLHTKFLTFHAANPHVYTRLVELCRRARTNGVQRTGIGRLFEILRWEHAIDTQGDEFQLNNNFRAFYARKIMEECPDLQGIFETRQQRQAHTPYNADENGQLRIA